MENSEFFCESCVKHHRLSFKSSESRASKIEEIVHVDVCGPKEEKSFGGARYFVLFKNNHSQFRNV